MDSYAIVIVPLSEADGGGYVGYVPDLPGCMGDGETREEALQDTTAAMQAWLETNANLDRPTPEPGSATAKIKARDRAMLSAMRAALDYIESQDGEIRHLERKLETLLALMQEDGTSRTLLAGNLEARLIGSVKRH